ncbi:Arp9 protein [Starmerella bacillaris]|uniref:Arp9 protein n=1 Tax=Starmerella bacillaris TaxID=1247836 RepID=A0AAV5RPE0_STABA|nr:Arp9 protein [Starmerella bacillaris]
MTLEFRDHQVLVISPGSQSTQVQLGLNESLLPASHEIATVVYFDEQLQKYSMTATETTTVIHPIQQGAIADEKAFFYFLKMVYKECKSIDGLPPALFMTISLAITRRQLERLTQYVFEEIKAPALALMYLGICTSYAFLSSDCLIVDVGLDKTEISVINQFDLDRYASSIVPIGGSSINRNLKKRLPLTADQIEDLKGSPIYEVLSADQRKTASGSQKLIDEEDGVVDIAAIVSSGHTREILDRREKMKSGEIPEVLNIEMPENTFVDRNGETITVGMERFVGCDELLNAINDAIADVLHSLSPKQQQHVFDNFIVTGRGSLPSGFRDKLVELVEARYVVRPLTPQGIIAATEENDALSQAPTTLTVSRLPDHFPEWKNHKWDDYTFLGAQICAKQILTSGIEGLFVSRSDYNEIGPTCIGDILT